jgi:prophage regulatory protein
MSDQIKKLVEVKSITGLSTSSIYRLASEDKFPKPIKLGSHSSGWLGSEIDEWLDQRIRTARSCS